MPKPRIGIKVATLALAAGLSLAPAHNNLHISKMPEGWECTKSACVKRNTNFSSRTSMRVFEHKDLPEAYKRGKVVSEKQLIDIIFDLPNMEAKLDLIEGFCFKFFVADPNGGHFDLAKMKKTITNKQLERVLENFMKNHKELRYRKVLEIY